MFNDNFILFFKVEFWTLIKPLSSDVSCNIVSVMYYFFIIECCVSFSHTGQTS